MGFWSDVIKGLKEWSEERAVRKSANKRMQQLLSDERAEQILIRCVELRKDLNKHLEEKHGAKLREAATETPKPETPGDQNFELKYEDLIRRIS